MPYAALPAARAASKIEPAAQPPATPRPPHRMAGRLRAALLLLAIAALTCAFWVAVIDLLVIRV